MSLLDFFKLPDINQGVTEYSATPDAILLDVRTPQEYQYRRIPGSQNIPLQSLNTVDSVITSKETPIFVYCHSGSRSSQAAKILQRMGYSSVKNIGGISSYTGRMEY